MSLRTLVQMVQDGVRQQPDLDLLTFVDVAQGGTFSESVRTYRQLLQNGERVAGALVAEGMGKGQAFAIIMRNHPEFVDAMVGSEIAGTIFVPIDPRTRGDKLIYMLRFADCRGAIIADYVLPELLKILPELPNLDWVWVVGEGAGHITSTSARISTFGNIMRAGHPAPEIVTPELSQAMQLLYTSGTTGDPKAIVSTYERFAAVASLGPVIGLKADDRLYTGLSLTHANAQLITLGNALNGGRRLVISRQFTKSKLWEILSRYGCTTFNLLGGMATAIYAEPAGPFDRKHKVRYVLSAGMPMAMWRGFEKRFGVEIFEFYGAAEGGMSLNPPAVGPIGSIGKPPPGLICKLFDENDVECPPGVLGEICFCPENAPVTPVAYLKNEAASAAKTRGGWFRTGDKGYKDAEGFLYFAHRMEDSIRRNGDFISASQIETEIATLDGVADVYVYGVATADNAPGEKEVIAAIVLLPGHTFDPCLVFEHCRQKIGTNSVPGYVQIVSEIPKTASEKPQSRFLVNMLTEDNASLFSPSGRAKITPLESSLERKKI
jgi:crotonobetaine/carnitine-CoA ligase